MTIYSNNQIFCGRTSAGRQVPSNYFDIEQQEEDKYHTMGMWSCRLKIPHIEKFDLDVLILMIDDSPYGMRVPIQIGTLHIDMALELATEERRRS